MRVCIIRNAEARSNAGIYRIIDALTDMGAETITLTRSRFADKSGKFLYKPFKYKGKKVSNFEFQYKTDVGRGLKSIFQLIIYQIMNTLWLIKNRKKFDVVHAFDLDAGIPAFICAFLTRKKFIYHIADFYVDSRQGIPTKLKSTIKRLEFLVVSKSDATIICTEERKEQIKGSHPKKLFVIHNSPIVESNKKLKYKKNEKKGEENSLTLGYVGGLTKPRFIQEVINVAKQNPAIKLNIAGFGYLENTVKEATANHKNIKYYGRVSYNEALDLYSHCDVMFAMYDPSIPNHKYSAPNKVYEAMMLGLPIIVAKETGINKLVEEKRIGFSINYNKEEFTDKLNYLINHEHVLNQLNINSRNAYESFSWEKMKLRLTAIYKEIDS